MKKTLFIPLIIAASLSLASCGNSSADKNQTLEITGLGLNADEGFIGAFKADNPDINVVINDFNDDTDCINEKEILVSHLCFGCISLLSVAQMVGISGNGYVMW